MFDAVVAMVDACLGGISQQDLGRLQRLQNKSAQLFYQKPQWSHAIYC